MERLTKLFEKNRAWAASIEQSDPSFFGRLAHQQSPKILWIGCADSRVPATEICGMDPGEIFVHRNVSNLVIHTDLNSLSVIQYAVEVLKVQDVIVCGHYGCGGVQAALGSKTFGHIDNWLRHIKDCAYRHREELASLDGDARINRMCELNVQAQVENLAHSSVIQDAWKSGSSLTVHGLVYSLQDGLLKDLKVSQKAPDDLPSFYRYD